ncbi:MAG TPA: hypothetical protein VEU06_11695 [Micropepsaceae bacterium]|nr:hypothetical protein [Micropepsaceae bacterium]
MIRRAAILVVAACAIPALAQPRDALIVPGERVGPIALGLSEADLLKVAGAPASTLHQGNETVYSFGRVTVQIGTAGVDLITVDDPRFETADHLRLGLAVPVAISLLGQPVEQSTLNGVETLEYEGMALIVRNNLVMQIRIQRR